MIDDTIGLLGKEEDIGKPIGSDIRENKKTLIRKLLFEKTNTSDKNRLAQLFGNKSLQAEEIKYICSLVKDLHIDTIITDDAISLTHRAQKIIKDMELAEEGKAMLYELAEYNLSRVK
jgi:geranylgeranyl diphosphate synthase type I